MVWELLKQLNNIVAKPIVNRKTTFVSLSILLFLPELFMVVEHDRWNLLTTHLLNNYLLDLFFSYVCCTIIEGGKCIGRYVEVLFCVIINLIVLSFSFGNLFLIKVYHTQINAFILQLIFETNTREASDFVQTFFFTFETGRIIILYCAYYLLLLLSYYISKEKLWLKTIQYLKSVSMILFVSILILNLYNHRAFFSNDYFQAEIIGRDKPIHDNLLWNLYQGYSQFVENQSVFEECANSNGSIAIDSCLFQSSNIVVIIGESFNRHHSSLYGYSMQTNPRLSQEPNLYVFTDVITSVNLTSEAFKNFLSCSNLIDTMKWNQSPLFPAVFKRAGYNVVFYSNQFIPSANMSVWNADAGFFNHPSVAPLLFNHRNTIGFMYDEELVDYYKQNRDSIEEEDKNLIIFHLTGQHLDPVNTFPSGRDFIKANDVLRPELDEKARQQIANYDNSTIYNDSVVSVIIDMYREKDAIVLYFADHGDEANDFRLHVGRAFDFESAGDPCIHNQFDIPFLIYISEQYKENHPDIVHRIEESVNNPFMTDKLPHLLFDIAGIFGPFYYPKRSLINSEYVPSIRKTRSFVYDQEK